MTEKHADHHHSKKAKPAPEENEAFQGNARELEKITQELESFKDKYLRAAADFENTKKRLQKEQQEAVKFANERFLRGLLPILDNFERALAHLGGSEEGAAGGILRDGIMLIQKQLLTFAEAQGLMRLQAVGKLFDPHVHEAIAHVDSESHPDEMVIEELEAGYVFQGRLLRPARVKVSRMPHQEKTEPAGSQESSVPGQDGETAA